MMQKQQLSLLWFFGVVTSIAVLLGLSIIARQSRSVASMHIWVTPIVFGTILAIWRSMKGRSLKSILISSIVATCVASVFVGALALSDKTLCNLLDPGGYYLSVEVWMTFFWKPHEHETKEKIFIKENQKYINGH